MSPRTPTLPATEASMWRKLLSKVHPDAGGDHELFIWASHVRDSVCTATPAHGRPRPSPPPPPAAGDAVPFDSRLDFAELTAEALRRSEEVAQPYARLLMLLADCEEAHFGTLCQQQQRGATFKQLAAIAHSVGMTKQQRTLWYRVAESIPLSRRHAGHMLGKLK